MMVVNCLGWVSLATRNSAQQMKYKRQYLQWRAGARAILKIGLSSHRPRFKTVLCGRRCSGFCVDIRAVAKQIKNQEAAAVEALDGVSKQCYSAARQAQHAENGVSAKPCRVMPQVIFHECGDKEVAVVILRMAAQRQRLPRRCAGSFEQVGMQLGFQKIVTQALVNQNAVRKWGFALCLHEAGGVMRRPLRFVSTQVACKCLASPGALCGGANRCKSGHGLKNAWML